MMQLSAAKRPKKGKPIFLHLLPNKAGSSPECFFRTLRIMKNVRVDNEYQLFSPSCMKAFLRISKNQKMDLLVRINAQAGVKKKQDAEPALRAFRFGYALRCYFTW